MNWSFDRASLSSVAACQTEDEAPAKSCCEHGEGAESDRNLLTSALRSGNDGRLGPPEPISRLMALVRSSRLYYRASTINRRATVD